jgi:nucleotide-binding universal stress UspA family protein
MKKIIAAIDFSNATSAVLSAATEIAKAFGAELHLLHVIEPEPTYTAYGLSPSEFPAIHEFHLESRKRAQKALDDVADGISTPQFKPKKSVPTSSSSDHMVTASSPHSSSVASPMEWLENLSYQLW